MAEKLKIIRQIIPFANYFIDFKKTLEKTVLKKIYQVFLYIMTTEKLSTKFFKAVKGSKSLYEIRVEESGNIYRIFCCFDDGQLVVLFNAFQKKTQKTPTTEIEKAERIMKEYFETKNSNKC